MSNDTDMRRQSGIRLPIPLLLACFISSSASSLVSNRAASWRFITNAIVDNDEVDLALGKDVSWLVGQFHNY